MTLEIFNENTLYEEIIGEGYTNDSLSSLLLQLNEMILMNVEYDIILEKVLTDLMYYLESSIGNITLLDNNEGGTIKCLVIDNASSNNKVITFDLILKEDSFHSRSIVQKKSIISNDISKDPRTSHTFQEGHPCVKTYMSIPIILNEIILGQISFGNKKDGYSIEDIKNVINIVELCGLIIDKKDEVYIMSDVNDIKDKFLNTMSHELRTPLNGIIGIVDLMSTDKSLTEKHSNNIRILQECSIQLLNMLNNILDFSKMVSNRFTLSKDSISLRDTIRKVYDMTSQKVFIKNLKYNIEFDENIPKLLHADEPRIIQILTNLINNSIKFTNKGNISLSIKGEKVKGDDLRDKWKINISVSDTGIGIDPSVHPLIFDMFQQTHISQSSEHSTGLGLSIVKELVHLMNGKITVSSRGIEGEGTTFNLFILLDDVINTDELLHKNKDKLKGLNVLVVDDRIEIRMQMSKYLFEWGCIPICVSCADEALHYLKNTDYFKIAFIDICMIGMDGVQLANEIRDSKYNIKLIGSSSIENVKGKEVFDDMLYKPINKSDLLVSIIKNLEEEVSPRKVFKKKTSHKRKKINEMKVLIVEDDYNNAYTIKELLESFGIKESNIKHVENGKEAVKENKKNKYDIILMDILMPVMDGKEASMKIKNSKRHPIIIAVSAITSDNDKSYRGYFDDYITKPVKLETLKEKIYKYVK